MNVVLDITGVAKAFGGVRALRRIDLDLRVGEILGLIGPNGSGKTTLVNVVSGFLRPDQGRVMLNGHPLTGLSSHRVVRAGLARTFQNLRLFRRRTALENVLLGQTPHVGRFGMFNPVAAGSPSETRRARELLRRFGLGGREDALAGSLSFGDQKRLELARALAGRPSVVLLDEPAGGMNPSEIEELKTTLATVRDEGVSILLIEHNMKLVMGVSDRIAVMVVGEMIATGSPAEIRGDPRVIRSYLGEE